MATATLYTPQVLELATALAGFPLDARFVDTARARSPSCGSTIEMGLLFDADAAVTHVGLRSQACAIGQASAAIFARHAIGRSFAEIRDTAQAVSAWLKGEGAVPAWPGMEAIAPAPGYPGRHGAVMLPWNAALQLLP
ncbi:iron-sulfur cluster assembly scaffold protein [Novosphingobium colocasiae]|uniref:iron-sulfur cluster assembly scaffold protein n=1 Tax=Novosphingobium colocasiae TaxID=1256513 RepID=UPI0035AF5641